MSQSVFYMDGIRDRCLADAADGQCSKSRSLIMRVIFFIANLGPVYNITFEKKIVSL